MGIWSLSDSGWHPEEPVTFQVEKELHDLVFQVPGMLPLAGSPSLVVLGREVRCDSGYADLVAVEVATGRPVVIEIKLASNTDRRQVLTQVLGYAAHLRRLDKTGFNALLVKDLATQGLASAAAAVEAASQDPGFDLTAFETRLEQALDGGLLRCVVVIDAAPADLVELVGYLQEVTNDRLSLDLVTVTAYAIGDRQVLVPQLVEPDRSQITATHTGPATQSTTIVKGAATFATSIDVAQPQYQAGLRRLLTWAQTLEDDGLAVLYTSVGKGRWVLNPRLLGQDRGLVVIWNEKGGRLSPYRTVFQQEAPDTLEVLSTELPKQIGQGNYINTEYNDRLLELLRAAYEEAAGSGVGDLT